MAELLSYLDDSGVNIVMTPGTYSITAADIDNGLYGTVHPVFTDNTMLLHFSGSNSTYDFTGVKLNIDTAVFSKFGSNHVNEVHVTGSNVVIKNLTMEDIGWNKPSKTALGIALDGIGNRLEGIHMTVRGSFPYGYGDMFGKGAGSVIGHNKHAAILVRGENNYVKNCTIMHHAYGHGIFVQGGINTTIEGCYLEGELRTTDDVLAEAGTGSPADGVNFMTVYGYKVPAGWMFSKQEDGIRAYNDGPHWQTGVTTSTSNMNVIDCTVKRMRSGVVIGFANDTKYVDNCTTIECETQYSVGSGATIVNSRGDTKYGPLYVDEYDTDKNNTVDLTVLSNEGAYGNDMLAYFGGQGHKVTFRNTQSYSDKQMDIVLSGDRRGLRFGSTNPTGFNSSGVVLNNYTLNPVISDFLSSNNTINSCGLVTDTGSNNTIIQPSCSASTLYYEAEAYATMNGTETETTTDVNGNLNVKSIDTGDWIEYTINVPSTGLYTVNYRVASAVSDGVILLQSNGNTLATTNISATGGLQTWTTLSSSVSLTAGLQNIRLYAQSGGWNINWFDLIQQGTDHVPVGWVAIAPYQLALNVGQTQQLTTTVYPANATNKNVTYVCDNPTIASVDATGLVTAKKLGNTFVNIYSEDGNLMDTSHITVSYAVSNNLALAANGGVASQSTTAYDAPASRANDGNTNGNFASGSVSHTENGAAGSNTLKWWQVDLGSDKTIMDIVIHNRTGSNYGVRLNNFTVEILNNNGQVTFSQTFISHPNPSLIINTGDVVGRIVKISKISDNGIALAEVEVFGTANLGLKEELVNKPIIYPNPVRDVFNIMNSSETIVEIYDVSGKMVLKRTVEKNSQQVDISNFRSGIYFVKLYNEGSSFYQKIIKK
ncbi:carbohydrate-binding protein [Flavobacterium fluviatile]|uniref:carbohydrate-binding protein n=1 Tax=Flavobacterium fluviatile TaxID=1862387 RepID=UPI0013D3FD26|nr:carbohydrate-binding protein [Flavobacterium fluviatile]